MVRRLWRRIRLAGEVAIGREPRLVPDVPAPGAERIGSGYGGWTLLPDLLTPSSGVFSFGVGEDISFDLGLIDRCGVTVHAFDPTPRAVRWVADHGTPSSFLLHEVGIADFDGDAHFVLPRDPRHVSLSMVDGVEPDRTLTLPVARLGTLMDQTGVQRLDLLKLDVEGAEYAVLEDLRRSSVRPRQLLVEFHHHLPGFTAAQTVDTVASLRSVGYRIFSVSANNHEVSFVHG